MIKQKPYQSRTFKKCLDIIEQLRYDLDKYIGMWRRQCNIAEEVMKERDRYKAALAEAMEEAKVWQDRYRKRGYVMDEHAKALERAEVAEAELDRYKQGVEVRCFLDFNELLQKSVIYIDDQTFSADLLGRRVRVLVMPEEG